MSKYYFAITDKKTAFVERTNKTDLETCLKLISDVKAEFSNEDVIIEIYQTPGILVVSVK